MVELIISRLPLSAWMSLLMLSGSWARPIEETATVWLLSLPIFLLVDAVRGRSRWGWRHEPGVLADGATVPGSWASAWTRRFIVVHAPLAVLILYLALLLFVPAARVPATALDHTWAMERLYSLIGAWYPMAVHEPAQIVRLGHARDASELRHFLAVALLLSLYRTVIVTGAGQLDLARSLARKRRSALLPWLCVLSSGLGLAMFALMGHSDEDAYLYLTLQAFVPCGIFALCGWNLALGMGWIGLLAGSGNVRISQAI